MAKDRADVTLPPLNAAGWARWLWRQLTSMRLALILLMLLALAALPGSFFPQRGVDPGAVARYLAANPTLGPWLDRFGFFDVYTSPWFSAIYLLLFISLIGCIVPRLIAHLRALRVPPTKVPARLARFAHYVTFTTSSSDEALSRSAAYLRERPLGFPRYRVTATDTTISAERGYGRETGNLLFHISLLGLLIAMAVGHFWHYRAQVVIVEGASATNSAVSFDSMEAGPAFNPADLVPFTIRLDAFDSTFTLDGQARDFTAQVTVTMPGEAPRSDTIKVNHPLSLAGTHVYLQGNGYAPVVVIHDAHGALAFSGPVPFLPQDGLYNSTGVIKVPDTTTGTQLGFAGLFFPTVSTVPGQMLESIYPEPLDPVMVLTVWEGDLGLDTGIPQNIYQLDDSQMTQVTDSAGAPVTMTLRPGERADLPGVGTVEFVSLARFVALDLRHDPALAWILGFALAAMLGLALSLFVPRRRMWVRTETSEDGSTVVHLAGLARGGDGGLAAELRRLQAAATGSDEEGDSWDK